MRLLELPNEFIATQSRKTFFELPLFRSKTRRQQPAEILVKPPQLIDGHGPQIDLLDRDKLLRIFCQSSIPLCRHAAKLSHTTPFVYRDRCNIPAEGRRRSVTI